MVSVFRLLRERVGDVVPRRLAADEYLYRHEPQSSSWQYRIAGATVDIPVNGAFSSNESHALIAWAKAGMGITRQPEWLVDDALRSGRLIRLLEECDEIAASEQPGIYAIFPKPCNHPKKVEAFVKFFFLRK